MCMIYWASFPCLGLPTCQLVSPFSTFLALAHLQAQERLLFCVVRKALDQSSSFSIGSM